MAADVAFDDITFYFTSTTCPSVALFEGMTIHSATHLNKRIINDSHMQTWKNVRILIIDEISFFKVPYMERLDKILKQLTRIAYVPFGGVSIVF